MDPYLFCLCLSFAGLVLMALAGLGHHHAGHHSHGRGGRSPGHRSPGHAGGMRSNVALAFLGFFSPRFLFSVLLGVGATGLILQHSYMNWGPLPLALLSVFGGLVFERFIVGPFWNLLFGFASKPACMLETACCEAGKAVTDFDRAGHGLVLLELDGQARQILGTLIPEERTPGAPRVRTGERLFIHSVDHRRNVCTVSRLGC